MLIQHDRSDAETQDRGLLARGQGLRARIQDLMAPIQVTLAGGCFPNRDFSDTLRHSAFQLDEIVPGRMP